MSTPGGPYGQEPQPQYQVDPFTGQPASYQGQQQSYPGYQQAQYGQVPSPDPYGQQQQQQPGGYQGFGMYQPEPPKKSSAAPWIIVLVAVLVLGGGGFGAWYFLKDDKGGDPQGGGAPVTSSAPSTTKGSKPTSSKSPKTTSAKPTTSKTPTEVEEIKIDAITPGFQGVYSYKDQIAYDIPTDWKVETPGTIVGFEDNAGKPTAVMHGVSTYRPEACTNSKGSYRGRVGVVTVGPDGDPTVVAKNGARIFAEGAALNEDGSKNPITVGESAPTKVNQGKLDAMTATATMTITKPGSCPSPTMQFTSVAFKTPTQTVVFIAYMDQGVPDALPAETLQKIISSLRPSEG